MKLILGLLTLGIGGLMTIHMSMNATVGIITENRVMANGIFWLSGFVMALCAAATHWDSRFFISLKEVPLWMFAAGALGASMSIFLNRTIPVMGVASITFLLMLGQLATSSVLSHKGLLGTPVEPIDGTKVLGLGIMVIGSGIFFFGNRLLK